MSDDWLMMTRSKPKQSVDLLGELQLLTFEQVMTLTTLSENKLRSLIQLGRFPRFIKLGRRSLFRLSDVQEWLRERFEE